MGVRRSVSVLGVGWLGLPLVRSLKARGFYVKGSTTQIEKIPLLSPHCHEMYICRVDEKIDCKQIPHSNNSDPTNQLASLQAEKKSKNGHEEHPIDSIVESRDSQSVMPPSLENEAAIQSFLSSERIIINIPPSTKSPDKHLQQIRAICKVINNSQKDAHIIYASSTSVYGEKLFERKNSIDDNRSRPKWNGKGQIIKKGHIIKRQIEGQIINSEGDNPPINKEKTPLENDLKNLPIKDKLSVVKNRGRATLGLSQGEEKANGLKEKSFFHNSPAIPSSNQIRICREEDDPSPETDVGRVLLDVENWLMDTFGRERVTIIRFGGLVGKDRHPGYFFSSNAKQPEKKSNRQREKDIGRRKSPKKRPANAPVNLIHQTDAVNILIAAAEETFRGVTLNGVSSTRCSRREFYLQAAKSRGIPEKKFLALRVFDGQKKEPKSTAELDTDGNDKEGEAENHNDLPDHKGGLVGKLVSNEKLKSYGFRFEYEDLLDWVGKKLTR